MQLKNSIQVLSERFNHDLHWLFKSPPLMDKSLLNFSRPSIIQSSFESKELKVKLYDFITNKNLKMLGPYFEGLWQFYIENSNHTKLIEKNLQVRSEKQTLGEFDFIYFDHSKNSHVHLEVSVKYYLGVPALNRATGNFSDMNAWIGPNKNDRLDKKFYKLKDRQSKLSESEVGKEVLFEKGISEIRSEVCLLGYLFYPYAQTMNPPESSFSRHNRGSWLSIKELSESKLNQYYWKIIEKPFWLFQSDESRSSVLNLDDITARILEIFSSRNYPVLVARYSANGRCFKKDDSELLKFEELVFVVPDDWE